MKEFSKKTDFEIFIDSPETLFFGRNEEGESVTNVPHRYICHSPTGMEWGYGGSGPCDLALNILALYIPLYWAFKWRHDFKWEFVATMDKKGGQLKKIDIAKWVRKKYESL